MFDSVTIANLPHDADMVAGYVDGHWPTFAHLKAKFPKARRVSIATAFAHEADVLDVENRDGTPAEAVSWTVRMRLLGRDPVVYTTKDVWAAVLRSCASNNVTPPKWWAADWTGNPHVVEGSVATQFASPTVKWHHDQGDYDVSLVSPDFPAPFITKQKGTTLTIPTPTKAQLVSVSHELAGLAAIVTSLENSFTLPPAVRTALVAIGGAIVAAERLSTKASQ